MTESRTADEGALLAATPVEQLKRVGPKVRERLGRLGIHSVFDLLLHLPNRYQDRSRLSSLAELVPGVEAQVEGEIVDARLSYGRRRSLRVMLADSDSADSQRDGALTLRFFHFSAQQMQSLSPGSRIRCFGEARLGPTGLEMIHPEYRLNPQDEDLDSEPNLTPIYPSTEGFLQSSWRGLMEQALVLLAAHPPADPLDAELPPGLGMPRLADAIGFVHRPPLETELETLLERRHPAFLRLSLEELVAHQLSLRRLRGQHRHQRSPVLEAADRLRRRLLDDLPFILTADQQSALAEITDDLARPRPMQRMLQGDVGSGKTVVAALAALQAIESGHQAALMAPTELLSEQHWRGLARWLEPLGVETVWLAGRHKGREREAVLAAIAEGTARMVIGTHALIQEEVRFADLGLVIIDEQHRFGVHQRLRLREKGERDGLVPHQLIMTATPIPRSLAMTLYADLDLSVIAERPPGRSPVVTVAVPDTRRDEVIARVSDACAGGRQAYWVCTLVEESELLQAQAAEDTADALREALPHLRLGLVHGRQRGAEREAVMAAFAGGELDLLVATTVIEVGVDVPRASLMVIENPERLGLAQLHQLRGRVGRGSEQSHCLLLYHPPLSAQARDRLALIRRSDDGFEIAEQDLRMRGAGEVLGTRQSGTMSFKIADPLRDQRLVPLAQRLADALLKHSPESVTTLIHRWVGERDDYGRV